MNNLYNEKIETLISAALADGILTEKEKQVLFKKAQAEGIDLDEFEMVLDARLVEKNKKETSAPKSNKYGDVRKCPACGAMVPALSGACPECGYEFSGIEANLSSQKLAELLLATDYSLPSVSDIKDSGGLFGITTAMKIEQLEKDKIRIKKENDQKRRYIVETFPVPLTKSDLFEFLTSIKPRMYDVKDPLFKAYLKKYEECINKAKVSFSNDDKFRSFIDSFENEKKSLKRKHFIYSFFHFFVATEKRRDILVLLALMLLLIGGLLYLFSKRGYL